MTTLSSFGRRLATGLVAVHLGLGSAALAGASAAPAAAETAMPAHGAWRGFQTTIDGHAVSGAVSEMRKGGGVAFAITKSHVVFYMWKKDWRLPVGKTIPVRVTLGGETYDVKGFVKEANFIELVDFRGPVLEKFLTGRKATLDFADLEWTLDLGGMVESFKDGVSI